MGEERFARWLGETDWREPHKCRAGPGSEGEPREQQDRPRFRAELVGDLVKGPVVAQIARDPLADEHAQPHHPTPTDGLAVHTVFAGALAIELELGLRSGVQVWAEGLEPKVELSKERNVQLVDLEGLAGAEVATLLDVEELGMQGERAVPELEPEADAGREPCFVTDVGRQVRFRRGGEGGTGFDRELRLRTQREEGDGASEQYRGGNARHGCYLACRLPNDYDTHAGWTSTPD